MFRERQVQVTATSRITGESVSGTDSVPSRSDAEADRIARRAAVRRACALYAGHDFGDWEVYARVYGVIDD